MLAASGVPGMENTCASRQLKLGNHLKVTGKFVLRLTPVDLSGLPEGLEFKASWLHGTECYET